MKKITFILILLLHFSCKKETKTIYSKEINYVKNAYIATLNILFDNQLDTCDAMSDIVTLFCLNPVSSNFSSSKIILNKAYKNYNFLGPYIYATSSITNPLFGIEQQVDLNFINENYLDQTQANPSTGLVFDLINLPTITYTSLIPLHLKNSNENVVYGFHALEFLLYGEDLSLNSSGQRVREEFFLNETFTSRRNYMLDYIATKLYNEIRKIDLKSSFNSSFLNLANDDAMDFMLSGVKTYIQKDLLDRTLNAPINTLDRAKELCEFSDLSLEHIVHKIQALKYFFDPSELLTITEDFYMIDLIEKVDSSISDEINYLIHSMETTISSFTNNFENCLINSDSLSKLKSLVTNLETLLSLIEKFENQIKT